MDDGYALCLNKWALDEDIKNELGLLIIISSLTAEKGYCFASNSHLAKLFHTNETLISRKIKKLEQKDYITIEYEKRGAQVIYRKMRLSKTITDDYRKKQSTIIENDKDNNTSINNTSKKEIYKERFKKPTLDEVKEYCLERHNNINPKKFIDFYEANNWTDSRGNKVKSWKQKVITWEGRQPKQDELPKWFDKEQETSVTDTTQKEMENLLKEMEE